MTRKKIVDTMISLGINYKKNYKDYIFSCNELIVIVNGNCNYINIAIGKYNNFAINFDSIAKIDIVKVGNDYNLTILDECNYCFIQRVKELINEKGKN